ncbi:polymerase (RNA) III (DNA directed) polypeptide D, 44kDa L homeolog [Xenopus laevis]|nr:polymerase (RNA) III (DNA directed) polypeptide D, 44kDa L homeolog [Xenopus laevis]AAI00214.1 MGC114918 protein [Xenopus laevis]OCT90144.1 hypothetical protein XELAEV_18018760mg [Xenopus laevis]
MSEGNPSNDAAGPRNPMGRGLVGRRSSAPVTPGRLPSIRSRDLTLGGVRKKTFAPNIISRKIKEEPKEQVSVKVERAERGRDRRDGAGRGRGKPQVIQSHSIFEQGPAEQLKKKIGWDGPAESTDFGPSHIINIKREKRETEEETKEILRMLENDKFLDDPGLRNDSQNHPVQIPLAHSGWLFREDAEEEDIKPVQGDLKDEKMEVDDPSQVKVKEEPMEDDAGAWKPGMSSAKAPIIKKPPETKDVSFPEMLESLKISDEECLFFMQLPDTLPGQPPSQETRPIKTEVQSEDGHVLLVKDKGQDTKAAEDSCTLRDVSEGHIGKLFVRKSGKVQLQLGKVMLDVTMGTSCSFLQELVSVSVGESRGGEMMVLGHIQHKLVCSPDFESLLEKRQS